MSECGQHAGLDEANMPLMEPRERTVTSKDGTSIAYEQSGKGPALILVAAALADRSDTTRLARPLSDHFTVLNYDRRGRGKSGDGPSYSVEREIEDLEALIDAVGGGAAVFGSSSGALLALDAAHTVGSKISRVAVYEPPVIVDDTHAPVSPALIDDVHRLIREGKRADVVRLFFKQAMGIPAIGVLFMRLMPGWSKMVAMAHTVAYDLAITRDLQQGKPLPTSRWANVTAPVCIMTGGKSEALFHNGAKALAGVLPKAQHRVLKDQGHAAVMMAPQVFVPQLTSFLKG